MASFDPHMIGRSYTFTVEGNKSQKKAVARKFSDESHLTAAMKLSPSRSK